MRVAEVAFLLLFLAGVWIVSASLSNVDKTHTWHGVVIGSSRFRMVGAGVMLICAGLLLIVATHWGHLFS